jgi:hypothetical protein
MPRSRSRRPPTSQSSRPSTAADDYAFSTPGTASSSSSPYFTSENPQPLPAALHPHYAHYEYPDDSDALDGVVEEEEDDESDAEDVFAYLPPTTADQENAPAPAAQHQLQYYPAPPPAESPPQTTSSYDHLVQGGDAFRMRPVVSQSPQNDASPPYTHPRTPIHLDTTHGAKHLHVALPSPTAQTSMPGPSQPPQTNFLPGSAYDNPYQFTLSQISNYAPPSTQGSTFSGSDGLRLRHNINVGVIKRTRARHDRDHKSSDSPDDVFEESSVKMEDASIAQLVAKDIANLEYGRRPRRLEDGALDELDAAWSTREGSIK